MPDRVLHLRSSNGLWGPENQIRLLARYLPDQGFETSAILLYRAESDTPTHPLVTAMCGAGMDAQQLPNPWLPLRGILAVGDYLRRGRFQLLHTHGYKADLIGLFVAHRSAVSWVATSHGAYVRDIPLKLYDYLDRLALRFADKVIAVSKNERQRLLDLGVPAAKITCVHNAIDVNAFHESVNGRLARFSELIKNQKASQKQKLILFVGRLSPQKGLIYLLQSAPQIVAEVSDVHFLIVGDGPLRDQLKSRVEALGIAEAVTFLGVREDVGALMQAADVFVLPSIKEPFGIVLLEALSLGRPVVASAVGGIPEIVTDDETGLLVPPRDPAALGAAILRLLNNPAEATQLGEQGRDVVRQKFPPTEMARRTANVYRSVLNV